MLANWRTITVVVTDDVLQQIEALQKARNVRAKRSEIIRDAVTKYCAEELTKPGTQRTIYQEIEENERLPARVPIHAE